jgi:NAD(P)H-hydrate epimerase
MTRPTPPSEGLSEQALSVIALENSGRDAALWALAFCLETPGVRPLVVAGQGGVGAAAMTAARHLFNWGLDPLVLVIGRRERLREPAAGTLALIDRWGLCRRELIKPEQATEAVAAVRPGDPLIYGAAGDDDSVRATQMSDRFAEFAAAHKCSRAAEFSVRTRTAPPLPGGPRVRLAAAPRDREAMRLLDSTAIREYGLPALALMENAGYWAARELWQRLPDPPRARVAVLAGRGNNGGDGFVLARHLAWWGVGGVQVFLAGETRHVLDDARANLDFLAAPGVPVTEVDEGTAAGLAGELAGADWLVDAVLGTGLAGKVRGVSAKMIEAAAAVQRPVLALDTPSGLDATDGRLLGPALPATVTVTFGVPKTGFASDEGRRLVGELVVADISLPPRISGAEVLLGTGNP